MTRFFSGSVTILHCQPWELLPVGAWIATSRHSTISSRETGLSKSSRFRTARVVVRILWASINDIVAPGLVRVFRGRELVARLRRKIRERLVHVVLCGSDNRELELHSRGGFGDWGRLG